MPWDLPKHGAPHAAPGGAAPTGSIPGKTSGPEAVTERSQQPGRETSNRF